MEVQKEAARKLNIILERTIFFFVGVLYIAVQGAWTAFLVWIFL